MSSENRYTAYDPFAWYFNRYWAETFAKDVQPILSELLLPHLPRRGRILDLCCGTGQLCHWLTACGFRVTGLDSSEEMIRYARNNAPRAEFIVADARSHDFAPVFHAVVSTFDSLNHLPTRSDLLRVFKKVYGALRPGGHFVFDVNTHEGFESTAAATYAFVKKSHACIVESSYQPRARVGRSAVTVFRLAKGEWQRSDFEILEYAYLESEVESLLAKAGFHDIAGHDAEAELGMDRGQGRRFFIAVKG